MLLRLFFAIICGTCLPFAGKAYAEDDVPVALTKMSIDEIEDACEKTIRNKMSYRELFKSLPYIKCTAEDEKLTTTDRNRIRDALKSVLFNVSMERTAYANLQEVIQQISEI